MLSGSPRELAIPLEVFYSFNVVGINVQSRLCHHVDMLHGTPKIRSEAFNKNRAVPVREGGPIVESITMNELN